MQKIDQQQLSEPIALSDFETGAALASFQEPFILTHADFLHLQSSNQTATAWATNFMAAALGYAISVAPKVVDKIHGVPDSGLKAGEVWVIGGAVFVSVLLFILGHYLPSDRRKVISRITSHFESAKVTHRVMKDKV